MCPKGNLIEHERLLGMVDIEIGLEVLDVHVLGIYSFCVRIGVIAVDSQYLSSYYCVIF